MGRRSAKVGRHFGTQRDGQVARPSQEEATQRLLAAIDAFSETAYGSDTDDELAQSRALSIERYLGKNINPAPVGRSQVRDRTTFEVVEWTKPSLLRIFTSGAEVCKFDPQGRFIRRYLPELARLDDRQIHAPWEADDGTLAQAGVRLGDNYPQPIVSHPLARQQTLARYAVVRSRATAPAGPAQT